MERPLELLDRCAREYGDIFTLHLGAFGTIVIVSHPEAVRQIFKAPPELFECRHFNENYRYVMGDHAIFLQDGPAHGRLKRIMTRLFDPESIQNVAAQIHEVADGIAQGWSSGQTVRLRPLAHEFTLRVLLGIVFGDDDDIRDRVLGWFRSTVWKDLRAWKAWTSLSRLRPQILDLISTKLKERRQRRTVGARPDLLERLLAARDDEDRPLTDEEIQDQVLTLMITAGDAVAVALAWALFWVGKNPRVQIGIRAECAALGDGPNLNDLVALPYLTATCEEVLRLSTVLPTVSGRRLTAPLEIMGYAIAPGRTLAPCEYLVHRRADIFPEPLSFQPERFLGRRFGPHEYFPFGGSNRSCVGRHLAPMELKVALATILSRWRLALDERQPDGALRHGTLLAPPNDLTFDVH